MIDVGTAVVRAALPHGIEVAFVVADPPRPEDLRRWGRLAALPSLRSATWSASPGDSPR